MDETTICAWVPGERHEVFSLRKNVISQNIMVAVDHDMKFTFVHTGWEGSAHDGRMFADAVTNPRHGFDYSPQDAYYLVDAGYANQPSFLAPYKGKIYHRSQFRHCTSGFRGPKELFNYRHCQKNYSITSILRYETW